MSINQMTPSEMLCVLSELQNAKKSDKEKQDEYDGEITLEELFGIDSSKTAKEKAPKPEKSTNEFKVEYSKLVDTLIKHDGLSIYNLDEMDLRIIAPMWSVYQEGCTSSWNCRELLKPVSAKGIGTLGNIGRLTSFVDRNILQLGTRNDGDYHRNIRCIMEGSYELDSMFINALMGNNVIENACYSFRQAVQSKTSIIKPVIELFSEVFSNYQELNDSHLDESGYRYGRVLQDMYKEVLAAIRNLDPETESYKIMQEFKLSEREFLIVLILLYYSEASKDDIGITKLINLLAINEADACQWGSLLSPQSNMVCKGVLEKTQRHHFWERELNLNNEIVRRLISETEEYVDIKGDWTKLLEDDDKFCLVKTRQTIDQLILPDAIKDIITNVVEKVKNFKQYDLSQWGLIADSLSENTNNGINILLHGYPGTGKTFAAGAIANSLGRQLVSINASQLRNHYYGDSQKTVKSCFQKMRKIANCSDNPPVFLLNEADQLIHTRLDLSQSCATVENAIQNIILEELETFPGVFIATTNLMDNIDEAFFRRFNYKIELPFPDADCRRQLWKLHLPDSIPGANYIDIDFLAENYLLTGGQIKLIVANACSQAMMKQHANMHITQLDMEKYVEMEGLRNIQFKRKRIGFNIP
jgi:DNA polymerase III delta prime subunit